MNANNDARKKLVKSLRNKKWYKSLPIKKKKERAEKSKEYFIKYPWLKSFYAARNRVFSKNKRHFRYKNLDFLITKEDCKDLWFKYKAYEMESPSIDRIDSKIGYVKDNCRFLERKLNIGRYEREKTHCKRGHEFNKENTRIAKNGNRYCIICRKLIDSARYRKNKRAGLNS